MKRFTESHREGVEYVKGFTGNIERSRKEESQARPGVQDMHENLYRHGARKWPFRGHEVEGGGLRDPVSTHRSTGICPVSLTKGNVVLS